MPSNLEENIARVHERIESACRRSGRRPEDVKLIAVSKSVEPERIANSEIMIDRAAVKPEASVKIELLRFRKPPSSASI